MASRQSFGWKRELGLRANEIATLARQRDTRSRQWPTACTDADIARGLE
ncbi:hypothetical protein [Bradyrhizobium sp. CIR3A]|nr:hypothetical protein [Bradyrhizobium sp. CIR3A]MBB4264310.1 hypothetical protein [Bradyrhizobium sp. CIR3A]